MRTSAFRLACLAAATIAFSGVAVLAPVASAAPGGGATNGTSHCDPSTSACPMNLNPAFGGPPPPFVMIVGTCPAVLLSDNWLLNFVSGSAVFHGTTNNNGSWGGFTAQGQAQLTSSDGTVQYAGHLTEWGGGGNNAGGQNEGGFTEDFTGTGIAGNLAIHANGHMTMNNAGILTASVRNATATCS